MWHQTGKISLVTGEEISEDLEGPRLREELLALTGNVRVEPADEATEGGGVERVRVPLGSETR